MGEREETLQEEAGLQRKRRESEESKRHGERRNSQFIPASEGGLQRDLKVSRSKMKEQQEEKNGCAVSGNWGAEEELAFAQFTYLLTVETSAAQGRGQEGIHALVRDGGAATMRGDPDAKDKWPPERGQDERGPWNSQGTKEGEEPAEETEGDRQRALGTRAGQVQELREEQAQRERLGQYRGRAEAGLWVCDVRMIGASGEQLCWGREGRSPTTGGSDRPGRVAGVRL